MSINLPRVKFANQILPQGKTRKFVLSDFNKKLTSSKPSKMHYLRAAKLQQTKLENLTLFYSHAEIGMWKGSKVGHI